MQTEQQQQPDQAVLAAALRPSRCPGSYEPMPASSPAALCFCGAIFQRCGNGKVWNLPEHEIGGP